ncbi:di-trans,poly-cis-decaprenylcistransferase [Streptosporangium nondiastaticum]|uniref:Isoprenyl transferase n=1 Tax=Streptosporangium nondiastaticum TaxID=35764 RepID=A0A9X7JV37_9ACTN|nr:polyprenyl diphosphate synthase [Streptosporangium nondiastaticum]PSJ30435.1 di-trans,poly-cis-decaprenylcistransferase [Streptosporangium nondiastaticum]
MAEPTSSARGDRHDALPCKRTGTIPRHVAVILDGNRRWAVARGLPSEAGYREGARRVGELFDWCAETGVAYATVWALSLANLCREPDEVASLLGVITATLRDVAERRPYRILPIGALDGLPDHVQQALAGIAAFTAAERGLHANVALAYDGREDIIQAIRHLVAEAASKGQKFSTGGISRQNLEASEEVVARHLYTGGQPDPDLVIRTSGEQRMSGFMPWQTAYAEYYFCPKLWPDFTRGDFDQALADFAARERRFGI